MTRETYQIRQHGQNLEGQRMFAAITIPSIPGVSIGSDRHETAPTLPTVRGAYVRRKAVGVAREALMDKAVDRLARHIAGLGVLGQVIL